MSYQSRRILTPGPTRKRKERENHHNYQHQQPFYYSSLKPSAASASASAPAPAPTPARPGPGPAVNKSGHHPPKPVEPVLPNRLLAGCMAHEFLTKGTLFGQKFDPARAGAPPVGGSSAEPKRAEVGKKEHGSYAEVASILKSDGAHIPGVVNPTQLARWIQM